MVTSVPFSTLLTKITWQLCAPVAGAVLVQWAHHYLHVPSWLFGLAVTSGGWSPGVVFLPFTACWFLPMGVDILHFRSFLSVSTFFVFAVVIFLQSRGSSFHSPCPPLAWDFSGGQCPFPSPAFAVGSGGPGVLGFRGSGSLCSLPALFVLSALLF